MHVPVSAAGVALRCANKHRFESLDAVGLGCGCPGLDPCTYRGNMATGRRIHFRE